MARHAAVILRTLALALPLMTSCPLLAAHTMCEFYKTNLKHDIMRYTKWLRALVVMGALALQSGLVHSAPEAGWWVNPNESGRGFLTRGSRGIINLCDPELILGLSGISS